MFNIKKEGNIYIQSPWGTLIYNFTKLKKEIFVLFLKQFILPAVKMSEAVQHLPGGCQIPCCCVFFLGGDAAFGRWLAALHRWKSPGVRLCCQSGVLPEWLARPPLGMLLWYWSQLFMMMFGTKRGSTVGRRLFGFDICHIYVCVCSPLRLLQWQWRKLPSCCRALGLSCLRLNFQMKLMLLNSCCTPTPTDTVSWRLLLTLYLFLSLLFSFICFVFLRWCASALVFVQFHGFIGLFFVVLSGWYPGCAERRAPATV